MSALDDRRQTALETYFDGMIGEAIEVATRVQITPEIEAAAERAAGVTIHDYDGAEMRAVLKAAFEAAGFEVVE